MKYLLAILTAAPLLATPATPHDDASHLAWQESFVQGFTDAFLDRATSAMQEREDDASGYARGFGAGFQARQSLMPELSRQGLVGDCTGVGIGFMSKGLGLGQFGTSSR